MSPPVFHSILFNETPPGDAGGQVEPPFFHDLNLDQVTASVTAGRGGYNLTPFFYTPLTEHDSIAYRHEVFRDLENKALRESAEAFAAGMRRMRDHLATAQKLHYAPQKQRWFSEAVAAYCETVTGLADGLGTAGAASRGFGGLRGYLVSYVRSEGFTSLAAQTTKLREELSRITYCLHIKGNRVRVRKYEGEEDLATLSGKLQDDLLRFRGILGRATSNSVIVMNEIFTSTTLDDALFLGRQMLGEIIGLGQCACVSRSWTSWHRWTAPA